MAEMEVQAALLKAEDGAERAKKEEVGMPAGSPGESTRCRPVEQGHDLIFAVWPILSYCVASIMMTVVNKFVVSGSQFNMTFLRESALGG